MSVTGNEAVSSKGSFGVRYYQVDAKQAILNELANVDNTLLIQATGTGKTVVGSSVVEFAVSKGHKVLWIAHREELIEQAVKAMRRMELRVGVEKAELNARHDFENNKIDVVISTPQTMNLTRMQRWGAEDFKLIVVDEAHHVVARTYRRVIDYFVGARVLGMTATADRLDKANLGKVFESVAYRYPITQAVSDGFLVPLIRHKLIPNPPVDLRGLNMRAGDFSQNELEERIQQNLGSIVNIIRQTRWSVDPKKPGIGSRPSIFFTPEVGSAASFAAGLRSIGISAEHVSCYSKNRRQIIEDFRNGRFQVLVNAMLLTEGADFPFVSCIGLLRPTKSRSLATQMVGRGTRPADDNPLSLGKKDCLILDFAWLLDDHKLEPVHPVQLYNDGEIEQSILTRAAEIMDSEGEEDIQKAIEQAKEEKKAREERLQVQIREREVRFSSYTDDPLKVAAVLGMRAIGDRDQGQEFVAPPGWLQINLTTLKVPHPERLSYKEAVLLRSKILSRLHKGLASHMQVALMISLGVPAGAARKMRFKDAEAGINVLCAERKGGK